MPTLTMCKGLPASGKTSWARYQVKVGMGKVKRVNKDDLRDMMDCSIWSKQNEWYVMKVRDFIIKLALEHGESVIVDDTNFAPIHENVLRNIAKTCGAIFVIENFTNVSPEICIQRDAEREAKVGEEVIMGMYNKYLKDK